MLMGANLPSQRLTTHPGAISLSGEVPGRRAPPPHPQGRHYCQKEFPSAGRGIKCAARLIMQDGGTGTYFLKTLEKYFLAFKTFYQNLIQHDTFDTQDM
jgi:hypothetical protein